MVIRESKLEKIFIDYVEKEGIFQVKITGRTGMPDRLACYKNKYVLCEIKRPDIGKLSSVQGFYFKKFQQKEIPCMVISSVQDITKVILFLKGDNL